jgi:hypothetical protein
MEASMIARGKAEKRAARTARLSAALRKNLKRRKAQVRGRSKPDDSEEIASPQEGADADTPDFRRNRGSD